MPDASPFLGLALSAERLPQTQEALQTLSDWRLDKLLKEFGYATSWAICATLSEHYGEKGNAKVWPLVEGLLGRRLKLQDDRMAIFRTFVQTCRKLGLASDGFDRNVQAFQIHAGVSRSQLHHLAKAFIAQERSLGLPDQDDIVLLNRWEDDALHFLDPGIQVLQRPILMDHSAWMAAAYVDWRRDQNALSSKTSYLSYFGEQLKSVFDGSSGTMGRVAAVPRLVWEDGRPQLSVPGQSRRFKLFLDGELHRVRAGRLWPLPYPLPNEVTWGGDQPGKIQLFQGAEFVLFDMNTGRQVDISSRMVKEQSRLTGVVATAVVVAKEAFQIDGIPSREIAPKLFVADVDLRSGSVKLNRGEKHWLLSGVRRPQISMHSRPIAKGLTTPNLWGPDAEIELDFGSSELLAGHSDGKHRAAFIKVEANGNSTEIEVQADGRGISVAKLADLTRAVNLPDDSDPTSVSLTLLRSNSASTEKVATRFKRKLNVWPGFEKQVGLTFQSRKAPANFIAFESKHVAQDDFGFLCLDRSGGYSKARMAFEIADKALHFSVRSGVLSGVLERVDGTISHWKLGDVIIKGSATKSDALVLNSPDESASLRIGQRSIVDPFRDGPTYAIPIATLDGGDIVHVSSEGLPTLIATVESATKPLDVVVRSWLGGTQITVEMPFNVGGVMVHLETENGQVDQSEISLDHRPVEKPSQFWLQKCSSEGQRVTVQVNGQPIGGLSLITLRIRGMGQPDWVQLSNARNDCYAFPLVGGAVADNGTQQVMQLEKWLSKCYALEAWDSGLGRELHQRWSSVIRKVAEQPGGIGRLLLVAMEDEESYWLPMMHVIQEIPTLFSEPAINFHVYSGSSGYDRILKLIANSASGRMRDVELNPIAMLAFPNARTAERAGEKLRNFKPGNLPVIFSTLTEKPNEWMGTDALGPDHASTSLDLLRDRVEAHEVLGAGEGEGRMSLRSANLNRVASALRDTALTGRFLSSEDEEDASVHMIEQALLAFAVASRQGPKSVDALINRAATAIQEKKLDVVTSLGEMIRLGKELFMFHLIAAEIETRSKS